MSDREPWPRTDVVLPERTLSVRRAAGDGAPAVFVHGLGGSSMNWTALMAAMRGDVDGYAIDLPGFGFSPPARDGDASPQGHARAVADFIDAELGSQPVHLFGNSMGGNVALQLAARRPDLVQTLTLISPALPKPYLTPNTGVLTLLAMPGAGEWLMARSRERLTPEQRVQGTIDACFAAPHAVPDEWRQRAVDDLATRAHLPYADDAFLRSLRSLLGTFVDRGPDRPWELAVRVECPTLLVYGLQDRLVDPRGAHRATKYFRHAEVLMLAASAHVAQMEQTEMVYRAWVSACRDRSGARN